MVTDMITLSDLLKEVSRLSGKRLPKSTLSYYIQKGLLPRAIRKPIKSASKKAGVVSYHPIGTVYRVLAIRRLLAEGLALNDIQERLFEALLREDRMARYIFSEILQIEGEIASVKEALKHKDGVHFVKSLRNAQEKTNNLLSAILTSN